MSQQRSAADPILLATRLRAAPEVVVTRMTLGLTIYLADGHFWASSGARSLYERFAESVGVGSLRWFCTSTNAAWRVVTPEIVPLLADHLSVKHLARRARHLFEFRIADDTAAPSIAYTYREIDPSHPRRSGFVQLAFPAHFSVDELLQLAIEVGQRLPIYSAVAGWVPSYSRHHEREAFRRIYNQCRRYLGMDVQVPEVGSWHAKEGLVGASWLTLVGAPLAERLGLDLAGLRTHSWRAEVAVFPLQRATLIRAGRSPSLGDVNLMEYPAAQAEVARVLAPYQRQELAVLPGRFGEEDATPRWARRFVEPMAWS